MQRTSFQNRNVESFPENKLTDIRPKAAATPELQGPFQTLKSGAENFNKGDSNFGNISIFPSSLSSPSKLNISSPGHPYEQAANRVEEKIADQDNPGGQTFTESNSSSSATKLTESGRNFYQRHVGSAAHRANFHIGGNADELGKLAKANALTFGNDVYIPKNNFAPETNEGRALIGHELAHVGHSQASPTQLFRDEEVPHYPTVEEQAKIEKILGRERKPTTVMTETVNEEGETVMEETVVMTGKNLTEEERTALAASLKPAFNSKIDEMVAQAEQAEKLNPTTSYTEDQVYAMAIKARTKIYEEFGEYITDKNTLTREETTLAERKSEDLIQVGFNDMSDTAGALARTVATTHCGSCRAQLEGLNSESKSSVIRQMVRTALSERLEFWKKAARLLVGGVHTQGNRTIELPLSGDDVYHSAVHELIHALAHPAFRAAFGDEDVANEGFTEYFTRQITGSGGSYAEPFGKVKKSEGTMDGPFLFDFGTGGSAEESMRLAYFTGRLDLIGWVPTSDGEREAVEAAGGAPEWDPEKAKEYAETYEAAAVEKQASNNNILGVGVFFSPSAGTDPTFSVRYARVIAQTQPYSRGRLLLEGQFMGAPIQDPKTLGGSLGIAAEYQDPYFFATGGTRFIGGATTAGDEARVDFSPFVGVGIRAWQRIRVGAEGFVLLPLVGDGVQVGGGATVAIEF